VAGLREAAEAAAARVREAAAAEPGVTAADVEAVRRAADALVQVAEAAAERATDPDLH
jgi:hypothetical protein